MILIVAQVILTNFTNLSVIAFELHLYAAMFLGGVAYAHVINSQVRVDLLASRIRAVPDTLSNCSVCCLSCCRFTGCCLFAAAVRARELHHQGEFGCAGRLANTSGSSSRSSRSVACSYPLLVCLPFCGPSIGSVTPMMRRTTVNGAKSTGLRRPPTW
jgi:hypothetical protein